MSNVTPNESDGHVPVLLGAVLELFPSPPRPGMVVADCTIGRGGHAEAILPRLDATSRYIGLDLDPHNLDHCRSRLAAHADRLTLVRGNFARIRGYLDDSGVDRVDFLLADLGFASTQVDDPARGFSFKADGPLDMRLDPDLPTTAADLVNDLPEAQLADLIYRYGEERLSRRIARKIVEAREKSPINSTTGLAQLVASAYGPRARQQRLDPATRTFQALRIAVNGELAALEQLLDQLPKLLGPGGIAAIISFHSLEDRPIKQAFASLAQRCVATRLTRKPIVPDSAEQLRNPRSRCAKLRAIQWSR